MCKCFHPSNRTNTGGTRSDWSGVEWSERTPLPTLCGFGRAPCASSVPVCLWHCDGLDDGDALSCLGRGGRSGHFACVLTETADVNEGAAVSGAASCLDGCLLSCRRRPSTAPSACHGHGHDDNCGCVSACRHCCAHLSCGGAVSLPIRTCCSACSSCCLCAPWCTISTLS